ncbi:Uncharacterized protein OBRU01_22775 [Operophtera brumata]|uniref:Uncharacterized protein n=1 Tax=Operophtera brumata TaxID=104452 RepID=A0A0L7KQ35_OPEBR|nr:Uncharacterized protein OBRU01_22775 [Operophtera brumata]
MCDNEREEAANLKEEFEWVLREEVHAILHQLHSVLVECAHRFPVPLYGNEGQKQDKFILTSQPEQLKCIVTLTGDSITHSDGPWKLQQIQDAANHLQQAIGYIDNVDKNYKALSPNLPEDLAISFYIQSHKLIFVAYQLSSVHGTMRIDSCQADCAVPWLSDVLQADCAVPWLSDVLFMLTAALHMCQQLKDKTAPTPGRNAKYKLIFVAYQLSSVHGTMRIDSCQADCAVPWLSDVLYRKNMERLRSVMHDQPQSALERAVWWTEHVLRHGGGRHLRAPAANMSWAEYLDVELLAVLALGALSIVASTIVLLYVAVSFVKNNLLSDKLKKS